MQKILDKLTETHWEGFCILYPKLIRFNPPKIIINNRLSKTAGKCEVDFNIVHISGKFLAKFEHTILYVTLPHELAHQIDVNLNGIPKANRWHGKSWGDIMRAYGLPADTYHTMVL
jgi:predicted SprT family Zn-dependent metalloprotease